MKIRCGWVKLGNPLYVRYHDQEWGKPIFTDARHFEYLILETFQAGLSWETILNKRAAFREALFQFDPKKLSLATHQDVAQWLTMPTLVRHEKKFLAAIKNAKVFLNIQREFSSFHQYIVQFTGDKVIDHHPHTLKELPASSSISSAISVDLKKRGMSFVGPKIIYAHLQAIGLINDHLESCFVRTSDFD